VRCRFGCRTKRFFTSLKVLLQREQRKPLNGKRDGGSALTSSSCRSRRRKTTTFTTHQYFRYVSIDWISPDAIRSVIYPADRSHAPAKECFLSGAGEKPLQPRPRSLSLMIRRSCSSLLESNSVFSSIRRYGSRFHGASRPSAAISASHRE